jgi:MFS family permease
LRHGNYRLYFFGQVVSLVGSWMQTTALTWLAYELTKKSMWAALVFAAQVLPTLALGVYGGSLADRWPRRLLICITQATFLILSLVLAALVGFEVATSWGLLVVAVLIGVVNAVDTPTRLAFVYDMVGREDLVNAIALNSVVFNVARFIGPALCGGLLRSDRPDLVSLVFLINAVSFVAVLVALACMRLPARGAANVPGVGVPALAGRGLPPAEAGTPTKPPGNLATPPARQPHHVRHEHATMGEAFRHLARRRSLVLLVLLAGALAFFGWPLQSLLPALSDQDLHAGNHGYALMLSAVGAGALVGALVVASFGSLVRRGVFLGAGVLLGVLPLVGLALTGSLAVAVVCCALSGAGLILFFATGQAMMQLGAGEHNRGKIMGIWLAVLSGAAPPGHLLAGIAADALGVPCVLALAAAGIALASIAVGLAALAGGREAAT